LEEAIILNVPLSILNRILELAASIDDSATIEDARVDIFNAVAAKYGNACPSLFPLEIDDMKIRSAIGLAAHKGGWFKTVTKGEQLGDLLFNNWGELTDNELKERLSDLSYFIDGNRL
jgi:hypothetical protein